MFSASTKKKIKNALPDSVVGIIESLVLTKKKHVRQRAHAWYQKRAVDMQGAIKMITGKKEYTSFYQTHAEVYAQAERDAESCEVTMGGPGSLELIYQLSEHLNAVKVIETGVAYGWSSLAFIASIQNQPNALLVSTDRPYPGRDNQDSVGVVVPEAYRKHWKLLFGLDTEVLPKALEINSQIDICHYDSDKSYDGRMRAYPLLWEALRPGGIFLSDDIGDNFAFRDFAKMTGIEPVVVEKHIPHKEGMYVGILCKPL